MHRCQSEFVEGPKAGWNRVFSEGSGHLAVDVGYCTAVVSVVVVAVVMVNWKL